MYYDHIFIGPHYQFGQCTLRSHIRLLVKMKSVLLWIMITSGENLTSKIYIISQKLLLKLPPQGAA